MDSDRLTRWLTLGANIGVFVGIILLLVELDQNRDMMRAQTRHQLAMGIVEMQTAMQGDQQLVDLMVRSRKGEELSETERSQVNYRHNALLRYWENVHYQYRQGLYDDVEFAKQREAMKDSFEHGQDLTKYWCRKRLLYSPEYVAEIDNLLPPKSC